MISLKVQQLTKKYNRNTIFDKISFAHQEGILGISGANGSGKSTLLKCLAYLLKPNSGVIEWFNGSGLISKENLKNTIGYAAPYINLYDEMTVFENLKFIGELSHANPNDSFYDDLLTQMEVNTFKDRIFKSLSTGQQQRVKLASSLVRRPKILFWDEPGSNLDEKGHSLVKRIVDNEKTKGTLVILASNDPDEISLCDNVISLGHSEH